MNKIKHLVAAVSCAALAACLVALPAEGGSGRGTLYSVTSLGGSPATYRLSVNSTSGVTVGDHVMAKVSGGGSGVWEVTAKTSSTVTVEDSLTEQNGSAFGAPVAGGADSVWAYSTPTATGLTIIPDGAQHWAAALRRNTYLQDTTAAGHALLSTTHTDTLASSVSRGSVIVGNSTPAYAEVAPTVTGTVLRFDGTDTAFASLSSVMDTAFGSTRGSILRRGASGWEIVAPGTSGYVLTSNGANADPTYQAFSTPSWSSVLAAGATSGAYSPSIDSGQTFTLSASTASQGVQISRSAANELTLLGGDGSAQTTSIRVGATKNINLYGGLSTSGVAGDAVVNGGASTVSTGGAAYLQGGGGTTGGLAGIFGGTSSGASTPGGQAVVQAGSPSDGDGGEVLLRAQDGVGSNKNGGNVTIRPGAATGSGAPGAAQVDGRLSLDKGADVASANDLTLGADGNYFTITGATTINGIADLGWQSGSVIHLRFASTPTVTNGGTPGAGFEELLLNGSTNWTPTAGSTLTLIYDGSLDSWVELARMTR